MNNAYSKWSFRISDINNAWTEKDIIYFRKAIGNYGIKDETLRNKLKANFYRILNQIEGYLITNDQSEKGKNYLLSNSLKKDGTKRKNCKLGNREIEILQNLDYHQFVGLHEQVNGLGKICGYLPIYKAVSMDGKSFEYVGTHYDQIIIG